MVLTTTLTKRGPDEADERYDEPQEEEEGGLRREQDDAAHHQRQRDWEQAVAQHAHRLEERTGTNIRDSSTTIVW